MTFERASRPSLGSSLGGKPNSERPSTRQGNAPSRPFARFERESNELEAWLTATPVHAKVKGMFIDSFLKSLDRAGKARPTDKRFVAFKDYPLTELMRLLLDSVASVYPDQRPKEGLRLLGQQVYPTLAETTLGRVLFSVAGKNWKSALGLTRKAYDVSLTPGTALLKDLTDNSARIELRDIWNFTDTYQVGVMEGAMLAYGVDGTVTPEVKGRRCDVDLVLRW